VLLTLRSVRGSESLFSTTTYPGLHMAVVLESPRVAALVSPVYAGPCTPVSEKATSETVWQIRMGTTSRSQESVKRGKKRPYCRFALPKTRDLDPSSYLPNSFSRQLGE
jgi:hypothetical protein